MFIKKQYYTYILTNCRNTVIYTGVTSDLVKRVYQHKNKLIKSFTNKYNVNKLVYYEVLGDLENAIKREKTIKGWTRKKKIDLITKGNSEYNDLYPDILKHSNEILHRYRSSE